MTRVLLVDDDEDVMSATVVGLRLGNNEVAVERAGHAGVKRAERFRPDVALIDLLLPDISGLAVLTELKARWPAIACVILTGYADVDSAVKAFRCGACDYIQKPVWIEEIVDAVARAFRITNGATSTSPSARLLVPSIATCEMHDIERCAGAVVKFIDSPRDATSVREFARQIGVSSGTFRSWCRTAALSPRRSLQFARALRATVLHQQDVSKRPQSVLNIVDLRTLSKFLLLSGGTREQLPSTVAEFVQKQRYVRDRTFLDVLGSLLLSR